MAPEIATGISSPAFETKVVRNVSTTPSPPCSLLRMARHHALRLVEVG